MARTVVPRANGEQTREKILIVAERLFAEAGYDGVSMRQVGGAADIPFALVTYHFQTKLGLYKAVFRRRSDLISTRRLDHLERVMLGPDLVENVTAIARALVEPLMLLREMEGGSEFLRLMSRETNDPKESERGIVAEYFDPVAQAAVELLRKTAPDVPLERVFWSYHFSTGALLVNYSDTGRIERISNGICKTNDVNTLVELAQYIASGLIGSLRNRSFDKPKRLHRQ